MSAGNKKHVLEAAALKYEPGETEAPLVVALGRGVAAEKMVEIGRERQVPIVPDAELAHMLNKLSVGDEIPAELYGLVAQVMVFIGDMDKKLSSYRAARPS